MALVRISFEYSYDWTAKENPYHVIPAFMVMIHGSLSAMGLISELTGQRIVIGVCRVSTHVCYSQTGSEQLKLT